jgi:type II secretory pathway pseudopilin PulG
MMSKNSGISLIVLIITIIVIVILSGAVILSLASNNPISQANKATFLSDLRNFQTELYMYETQQFSDKLGSYDPLLLQADETSVTYGGVVDTSKTIYDLIPSLGRITKYTGQFAVVDGKLVYQGSDTNRQSWSTEAGVEVIVAGEPKLTILPPSEIVVASGTDVVYSVVCTSNVALTTIDLTDKVELLDASEVALPTQPVITIGTVSGTVTDTTRQVDITIKTDTLGVGGYKLKVKAGVVTNSDGLSNSQDTISSTGFDVTDNVPPTNPVMLATPTSWTNGDVTVTIDYSADTVTKEYSFDSITWQSYTSPLVVSANGTTIYARGKDLAGNESGIATMTVSNIDKTIPTVAYGTNGGTDLAQVNTTVTVSDLGGSGINSSTLQYVWDTQNIVVPSSGWTTFTNGANLTKTGDGTYYLWIKAIDNAGNVVNEKSNTFIIGDVPVSTIQTENKTFAGLTTGYSYNNPVIPAGFVAVNTSDANWNNLSVDWNKGLVIQDASGNQFVWVPVDGTNVIYQKWSTGVYSYTNTTDDTIPSGFSTTNITTTYKGFYIARYESMFDYNGGSIRAASKKSFNKTTSSWTRDSAHTGYIWNFITYTDAKSYAENMASSYGYNIALIGTNLITGAEWDTTMKWIQNSGKSVTDSRTWGNYSNSLSPANITGYGSIQVSGYSNNWKAENIYDFAGNLWEWSSEKYSTATNYVFRGGTYGTGGATSPAGDRSYSVASYSTQNTSFRIALYIK